MPASVAASATGLSELAAIPGKNALLVTGYDSRLVRVELPKAGASSVERSAQPVVVTISAQGSYRVNDRALVNNERATLSAALRQVAGDAREGPVTIRADARATHQSVVTAMDVAAKQGFTQVNIATVSEQPES